MKPTVTGRLRLKNLAAALREDNDRIEGRRNAGRILAVQNRVNSAASTVGRYAYVTTQPKKIRCP